jgi:hypothetical protein
MNDMSERDQAMFHEWMRDVATLAFDFGHIDRKWRATDHQCESLKGYFDAGLTPGEGEAALFATRH